MSRRNAQPIDLQQRHAELQRRFDALAFVAGQNMRDHLGAFGSTSTTLFTAGVAGGVMAGLGLTRGGGTNLCVGAAALLTSVVARSAYAANPDLEEGLHAVARGTGAAVSAMFAYKWVCDHLALLQFNSPYREYIPDSACDINR